MTDSRNPYADWPRHVYLFVCVRDGGGIVQSAHSVAELHGISIDELKAECRRAGEELIAQDGQLGLPEQRVYDWARS